MFTGIVQALGIVESLDRRGNILHIGVTAGFAGDVKIGDSILVNGACLTVVKIDSKTLFFDVIAETLDTTDLKNLKLRYKVNLEQSLKAGDRLGGHIVTGHIDTIGSIRKKNISGVQAMLEIAIDKNFIRNIVEKGSVAIDGISLTVAKVNNDSFIVNIIPYTLKETTLSFKKQGDKVNIELDILGKYTNVGANGHSPLQASPSKITEEFLIEHGF